MKIEWAFPEGICIPLLQDINGNSQGGRVKVVRIQAGCQNCRGGLQQKSENFRKFQEGRGKID